MWLHLVSERWTHAQRYDSLPIGRMQIAGKYIVWGIGPVTGEAYIQCMRVTRARVGLYAVSLLMGLPVEASIRPLGSPSTAASQKMVAFDPVDDAVAMRESLRRDVAKHPGEFVVFATETGAARFVEEHRADAERETNNKIVSRGVVGYWQGKIVVV